MGDINQGGHDGTGHIVTAACPTLAGSTDLALAGPNGDGWLNVAVTNAAGVLNLINRRDGTLWDSSVAIDPKTIA